MLLTAQFVQDAINEEKGGNSFPVDFDEAWVLAGYSRKDAALRFLLERCDGLEESVHYTFTQAVELSNQGFQGMTRLQGVFLTVEGFKFFLARSNTPEGNSNLWALIDIEKAYRSQLERQFSSSSTPSWVSDISNQMSNLHMENESLRSENLALKSHSEHLQQSRLERVAVPNSKDFTIPLKTVSDIIGYAGGSNYVLGVLLKNFHHEKDFQLVGSGDNAILSEACFQELLIVARPQASAKRDEIPKLIVIERDRFYRGTHGKMNQRFPS